MAFEPDPNAWAEKMFGGADLGDRRRTERLVKVAAAGAGHPELSLSAAAADSAEQEGAYRLARNDDIAPQSIADAGFDATVREARTLDTKVLLAIGDTTLVNFESSPATDLGDVGGSAGVPPKGMFVHSVLLLDAEAGETIGLIEQKRWTRDTANRRKTKRKRLRPYEQRESYKWEVTSNSAAKRLGAKTMKKTIFVGDRESDIWLYLAAMKSHKHRFVIRACQDRSLVEDYANLLARAENGTVLGCIEVEVPQRGGRAARVARVELRSSRVTLQPPAHLNAAKASVDVTVNVLLAREVGAPADSSAEPLEWLLLATEPVETMQQAQVVLRYYGLRWRIEEFHKCWKSGARVEELRMETAANLERVAVIKAFFAVRLLRLREAMGHDEVPKITGKLKPKSTRPCTKVLGEDEWHVLWAAREKGAPPTKVPSMKWAYVALARLGGWKDTKRTGRAGWEVLWRGWDRLQERVTGYRLSIARPPGGDL